MCGIVGVCQLSRGRVGQPMGAFLRKALSRLEYRGYDSVGYAVVDVEGRLHLRKKKGKLSDVEKILGFEGVDGLVGLAHTRWATHGEPNDRNAHPHIDCGGCIAVIHNGTLSNYQDLRRSLASRGHLIRSDTDTELIAHLIEENLEKGLRAYDAFKRAVREIKGSYAFLAYICKEPGKIFFAKNVSPLVIGLGEGFNIVASDIPAVLDLARRVVVVRDGEVGYISAEHVVVEGADGDLVAIPSRTVVIEWSPEMVEKGGYPHYMLKEIHEQPIAIRSTLAGLADQVDDELLREILRSERIYVTGAGTSYHASMIISFSLRNIAGLDSRAFISSEYLSELGRASEKDLLVAVSQSGETLDTLMALRRAKSLGARTLAITNVVGSAIAREADRTIYMRAGPEIGVAATKTFATEVITGTYVVEKICRILGKNCDDLSKELENASELVETVIDRFSGEVETLSRLLRGARSMYFLGRGSSLPISYEGALKIKEISYLHAEAYPAGESKHGPIALVEDGFPVIFTVFDDEYGELIVSNIEEMRARRAFTIVVAPKNLERHLRIASRPLPMPPMKTPVASSVYVVVHQLLAYNLAVLRGLDPDKPRNLAKTVTVE